MGARLIIKKGDAVGNVIFYSDFKTIKLNGGYRRICYFTCFCGSKFKALLNDVKRNHTKSCGCMPTAKPIHGMAKSGQVSPEFYTWQNMIKRCFDKNNSGYNNYGGRGISVCERWISSFQNFLCDMGLRPSSEYSLDRIKNNGNYEPGNCRWATRKEQSNNTRKNVKIEYDGRSKTISEWSKETGIHPSVIAYRRNAKLPVEKILHKGHLQKQPTT